MITQADLGELIAKLFDRLPEEFPGCEIQDALILVELHDPEDPDATMVTIECSNDRVTVRSGMLEFGKRTLWAHEDDAD